MRMAPLSQASPLDRRTLLFGLGLSVVATHVFAQSPVTAIASPEQFRATELMGGDFAFRPADWLSNAPAIRASATLLSLR
jgi:hypothetical protein